MRQTLSAKRQTPQLSMHSWPYRHIAAAKGEEGFIPEVSMDETDAPDSPELLVILAALADEGIQLQTIAPKFTGRFNKGVDYVGDLAHSKSSMMILP